MPTLVIATNLPRASIGNEFLKEAAVVFQEVIGKPIQYICVRVNPDQMMSFGSTTDPCALLTVLSIGKLGVEENKAIAGVLFKLIQDKLNIPGTRAYIEFTDKPRSEVGYNGTTFAN